MILGGALAWNGGSPTEPNEIDRLVSIVEYGDRSGKIAALQRELGRLSRMQWQQLVAWHCDRFLGKQYVYPNYNTLDEVPAGERLTCRTRAAELAREFARLSSSVDEARKRDVAELCVAARGVALMNSILLALKKFEFKQDIGNAADSLPGLAGDIERWLMDYCEAWRSRNKESELGKVQSLFFDVCDYLRSNGV